VCVVDKWGGRLEGRIEFCARNRRRYASRPFNFAKWQVCEQTTATMPIQVINSGIVSDVEETRKDRNDKTAYGLDPYRKRGNVVGRAVARTTSAMLCVDEPTSKPALQRQREIAERDMSGNASEPSQPYRPLGSMHSPLNLKIVKYIHNKKEGKLLKKRIRLPRRR
jgi:hypothetical protein